MFQMLIWILFYSQSYKIDKSYNSGVPIFPYILTVQFGQAWILSTTRWSGKSQKDNLAIMFS